MLMTLVKDQATIYGNLVREYEDLGFEEEREKARRAWLTYSQHLSGDLLKKARRAYWDAYCRDPLEPKEKA